MNTFVKGVVIALSVAFLAFVGWQGAAWLAGRSIRVVTGFEGSPTAKVRKVSSTHWVIEGEDPTWKRPHFFLFRVEGAGGRTITFEIRDAMVNWVSLNPVYSYTRSLDDLTAFTSEPVSSSEKQYGTPNSPKLPDTSGQSWRFIQDVKWQSLALSKWRLLIEGNWRALLQGMPVRRETLTFTQKFNNDAYVCMRYPYTPGYNQRYLDSLTNSPSGEAAGNPAVRVITVGASREGRPLRVVKIGEGGEADEKRKPCVLIYAREHPDEQDSSWVAQGAIEYLISDAVEARGLRQQFTFLVIPVLDPDGAAMGVYRHIANSFRAGSETPESVAYSAFFKDWVDKGNPLQLVLNLHNLESAEGPHLSLIMFGLAQAIKVKLGKEAERIRISLLAPRDKLAKEQQEYSRAFYGHLQPLTQAEGFGARLMTSQMAIGRLENWLLECYGVLCVPFELNAQASSRHLTIADSHRIGQLLVLASTRYLSSQEARPFLAEVDATRRDRAARWQKYGADLHAHSALEAERNCYWLAVNDYADSAKRKELVWPFSEP
jgi:hypothetical protein